MNPSAIYYENIWAAFFALFSILIFLLYLSLFYYRKKIMERFGTKKVLQAVLVPRSLFIFWTKVVALCLVWVLAVVAFMLPKGEGHYPEELKKQVPTLKKPPHEVIFLVDASASMSVTDTRTGETRLGMAKEIVEETIRDLLGQSAVLYSFTSDTTMLSPPTQDYLFVRMMSRGLEINEGDIAGTDLYKALLNVKEERFSKIAPKLRTLILITDGGDTKLEDLPIKQRQNEIDDILKLLDQAKSLNLQVFVVGVGSKKGSVIPDVAYQGKQVTSSLDEDLLKQIAEKGGGEYFFANDYSAPSIAQEIADAIEKREASFKTGQMDGDKEHLIYDYYFQYPLGFAIILFGFVLFFPDTRKKK